MFLLILLQKLISLPNLALERGNPLGLLLLRRSCWSEGPSEVVAIGIDDVLRKSDHKALPSHGTLGNALASQVL